MKKEFNLLRNEFLVIYSSGVIITSLAFIFYHIRGYPQVITATETLDLIVPPIYMIPIFFPFGILIGELLWNWIQDSPLDLNILLAIECGMVALISFIRYVFLIPFSGHTIILGFYLPYQISTNKQSNQIRILIGLVVLGLTMYYKLFLWKDPITFTLGFILGIMLWIPGHLYRLNILKTEQSLK